MKVKEETPIPKKAVIDEKIVNLVAYNYLKSPPTVKASIKLSVSKYHKSEKFMVGYDYKPSSIINL